MALFQRNLVSRLSLLGVYEVGVYLCGAHILMSKHLGNRVNVCA